MEKEKSFVFIQHRKDVKKKESHPQLLIRQCNSCQLKLNDGTAETRVVNDPACFRVVTNETRVAEQFDHLVCKENHYHGTLYSADPQAWNPQIAEKVALGITNMIADSKARNTHRNYLANPGKAIQNLFDRHVFVCHGCKKLHGKYMRTHNRIAGECRFDTVPEDKWEKEWTCPGCSWKTPDGQNNPKPRGHSSHTPRRELQNPFHTPSGYSATSARRTNPDWQRPSRKCIGKTQTGSRENGTRTTSGG